MVAAIVVGLAMIAMYFSRTLHPPAGIDMLIIMNKSLPWTFLFFTVLPSSLLLFDFALISHNAPLRAV